MANTQHSRQQPIVGLLPAAGLATRIAPLPCSKELYPIGWQHTPDGQSVRPKVVCQYLLEKMQRAGATQAYIVLRSGKWDIPAYFGDGAALDLHLAYLIMRLPYGAPYTLDQAYPFVQHARIVFGFPDILFGPEDAFVQLLDRQAATKAEIVLGLFPALQPHKADMVELDEHGRVTTIVIKPSQTTLQYAWIIAVWTPTFTHFMHTYLAAAQTTIAQGEVTPQREVFVGDVIQAAIDQGVRVESVLFPEQTYLDIGTPDDLIRAVRSIE